MLSKSIIAATTFALAVSAQTSTKCSPLKQDCPADPAVGKKGISCDFTKGACDALEHIAGKAVTYGSQGAVSAVDAPLQAPTLVSKESIFFGRIEVEMQAAPGQGVVTSIVLLSDDLDEIDLEALGSTNDNIQSNTFSRGDQEKHDLLGLLPVSDLTGASHKYTVDWTTDRIEFSVDGAVKRTLRRADIPERYPESPMQLKVGAWVAGYKDGDEGRTHWAGGIADFSKGPSSSFFKRIKVTDYAGGSSATDRDVKEYTYGDRSGNAKSIQIHLADGSTTTADSPSSGSASSSSSSSSSSASSSTETETTKSSSTKSSSAEPSTTATTSTKETPTTESSATTSEGKTHSTGSTNSTMVTKTTTGTQTTDGSGTATQSTTVSSQTTKPTSGAAAGVAIGAGLAAVAAFVAL
ncbi:Concanavalin A-like lectin/glucanase [Akanthomyces lecanii RCEF 1005]|uniref:Concanavalin A-like lectin/glucanase n=1 Tax=Akanthomyces lecanii RCEF 1005 TaxID=1081108 RepID=A0A167WSN9_CORDF|nr:Concanavalin A-like lectin/glucanase [Akanthomyces lecanii RCEF 1005]